MTGSVLPDGTLHLLPVAEYLVVKREVEQGSADDCKVEYLMTSSAEVEGAWFATLRAPYHVNNRALDVDVSSKAVEPGGVRRNVALVECEDAKHQSCGQSKDDVHDSPYFAILRLVKLGDQSDHEAGSAGYAQETAVDCSNRCIQQIVS